MPNKDKLRLFNPAGEDITDLVNAAHKKKKKKAAKKRIQSMRIPVVPYKGK